jgi:DNA-binding transcriptional MerR regulator/methylmalonyl-CoA mutase cobalamin-binding subunit
MASLPNDPAHLPVRLVVRRTGLSPHVLRAWERRYGAVTPHRTEGGQRLYSDEDVRRLALLRRLTEGGHSIARVARLTTGELVRLAEDGGAGRGGAAGTAPGGVAPRGATPPGTAGAAPRPADASGERRALDEALAALEGFDGGRLGDLLERAIVALGLPRALDGVVAPLLREIGERWSAGLVGVAQEHLASAVVRRVLGRAIASAGVDPAAPGLVVGTLQGQAHELGAMIAAAAAAAEGWRIVYLGADLPPEEIARAAARTRSTAVALSVVPPLDSAAAGAAVAALRARLPGGMPLIVGGSGAASIASELARAGALGITRLDDFRTELRAITDRG